MKIARRALPFLALPALAQDRRPLRLVIPVGVGGVTDVVGRIMAEAMQPLLGRTIIPTR
jgi:tripartite-type tricarboxylate transporter receptor subunit TctC